MMPTRNDSIEMLIRRLRKAGFDRSYIEAAFPSWWSSDVARNPGAVLELKIILSRRLGVDLASLLDEHALPHVAIDQVPKYKLRRGTSSAALVPATATALAVARVITAATAHLPVSTVPTDPQEVRRMILEGSARWISFGALLQWCWAVGIPVIPATDLPGERKMDAAIVFPGNRPVVTLARNQNSSAWQLFILAHEIGHIALSHVGPRRSLIDQDLVNEQKPPTEIDAEEAAADAWAKVLLAGREDIRVEARGPVTPNGLARAAQSLAEPRQTDAGHLILLYAFQTQQWAVSNAALSVLEPTPRALHLARQVALANLNREALSDDNREFIGRLLSD